MTTPSLVTAFAVLISVACRAPDPREQAPPGGLRGLDPGLELRADPRVELISIVCRLAAYPEYAESRNAYARAVDAHFGRFRDHPAVVTAGAVRREHGVAFNAPISLAAHLDDGFAPVRPLTPAPDDLDERWRPIDAQAFAVQLQAFARDSDFASFWAAQADDHRRREVGLAAALDGYRFVDWFDGRFGPRPQVRIRVVPGALLGQNNYAAFASGLDGRREVLVALAVPTRGRFPRSIAFTVAHEVAHSYVNPALDARRAVIEPSERRVWDHSAERMAALNYGAAPIMTNESAVRALVVSFARERGPRGAGPRELDRQRRLGFTWIGPMTDAIDRLPRPIDLDALALAVRDTFAAWEPR